MNTEAINLSKDDGKRRAWTLRQKDTGWGRVAAQSYVPFYALYYAITRRTITPWLHGLGMAFAAGVLIGAFNSGTPEKDLEALGTLAGLAAAPIGYKIGTDNAREFAKKKLEEQ